MFISVRLYEVASFQADHLENPVQPGNLMVLGFYRNYASTVVITTYSKKAAPIYLDLETNKRIPAKKWTPQMKQYAAEKAPLVPKAPHFIKPTIVGYICIALFFGALAYLIYDTVRPKPSMEEAYRTDLQEKPKAGDIFYGRYELFKPGERVANKVGFGWFKVLNEQNGTFSIAMNKEMSAGYKPSNELNSTDFEESGQEMKIDSQESFQIKMISDNKQAEYYFSEKKK